MCGMQLKEHWEENFRTKCLNYKRQMASNLYTKIPRWETRERRANQPQIKEKGWNSNYKSRNQWN